MEIPSGPIFSSISAKRAAPPNRRTMSEVERAMMRGQDTHLQDVSQQLVSVVPLRRIVGKELTIRSMGKKQTGSDISDGKRYLAGAIEKARGNRSQEWLATAVGVAQQTVQKWEDEENDTFPTLSNLFTVARNTNRPMAYFFSELDDDWMSQSVLSAHQYVKSLLKENEVLRAQIDQLHSITPKDAVAR